MKMRHGKMRKSSPKCYMSERYTYVCTYFLLKEKEKEKKGERDERVSYRVIA